MKFNKYVLIGLFFSKLMLGSETEADQKKVVQGAGFFHEVGEKFNACMQRFAENVSNILTIPLVAEIMEFYKKNCQCPEDIEPILFQQLIENEFKQRVIGQDLNNIMQYHEEDRQGIVSDFGKQLQHAGQTKTKELQNGILSLVIPSFSLPNLSTDDVYLINGIKKDHPKFQFDDRLLCFATYMFNAFPLKTRKNFSNHELKKRAIAQIYNEFGGCFEQKFSSKNEVEKNENMNRFLDVLQYLFIAKKFQNFYTVTVTKQYIDFNVNTKVVDGVLYDIVRLYSSLSMQPRLKSWQKKRLEQLGALHISQEINVQEHFDNQVKILQKEYEEFYKELNADYVSGMKVLESERLHFEIQMQEYEEFFVKLKKTNIEFDQNHKELLVLEQKNYSKILENYAKQYLLSEKKVQKRKLENVGGVAYQILDECKCLLQDYENQMKKCEEEFRAKLDEFSKIEDVRARNALIFEIIQKRKHSRIELMQKDNLWTENHAAELENVAKLRQLEFEKIEQDEKNEKIIVQNKEKVRLFSLSLIQRYGRQLLQKQRIAKQEIGKIKIDQKLERLQKNQLAIDAVELRMPCIPRLSELKMARPSHQAESQMNAELFTENVRVRVHNPYELSTSFFADEYNLSSGQESNSLNGVDQLDFFSQDSYGAWYYKDYPVAWNAHGQCYYV
ncbi:hypothetical protein KBB68_02460 [Candidatus Babeliales bacterium]|nr:hypothetical protein [Candidatus Babeliales bacterium]